MNTEANQEKSNVNSTGERLRSARELIGLTQQNVAERLCLKLTTIREIEEDRVSPDLASTFLRGYIRSYARLVQVPEEELLPLLAHQAPVKATKVQPMQSYSLGKWRKKRDGWLMIFTWLVLFVVVGLTGAWWWQNHKAAQDDLVSMSDQNAAVSNEDGSQSVPLTDLTKQSSPAETTAPAATTDSAAASATSETAPAAVSPSAEPTMASPSGTQSPQTTNTVPAASADNQPAATSSGQTTTADNTLPTASAQISQPAANANALVMNFTHECWLEVADVTGKKLFSGTQRSGGKLSLSGTAPYRLKIGAPGAVQIQYQGKPVDLSRFVRNNQVARLTVGAN